jgi:hypothetical protein
VKALFVLLIVLLTYTSFNCQLVAIRLQWEECCSAVFLSLVYKYIGMSCVDAVITYSLYGGDAVSLFTIDPSLGVVSVAEPLNCVTVTYALVGVMASFSGNPPVIGTAQVCNFIVLRSQVAPHAVMFSSLLWS